MSQSAFQVCGAVILKLSLHDTLHQKSLHEEPLVGPLEKLKCVTRLAQGNRCSMPRRHSWEREEHGCWGGGGSAVAAS